MQPIDASIDPPRQSTRIADVGRALIQGVGAALLAGLIAGLAARGLMRLVMLAVGREGEFTLFGTAAIALIFGVTMVPGAVARALGARRTSVVLLTLGAGLVGVVAASELGAFDLTPARTLEIVALGIGFAVAIVGLALLAWRFASPRRRVEH